MGICHSIDFQLNRNLINVPKRSFEINFQIKGNQINEIQQQIKTLPDAQRFLNEYCNGKIEYLAYFDQAREAGRHFGITLSSDDFNPQYNRNWDKCAEKEQRGPPYHRYDYYFPRGCYGFGLNVKKYGNNEDWIQKNGNPNEWRILYHGTTNYAINSIVKNNLIPGESNHYANDDCLDEFGRIVLVGNGIYFSDDFNVCLHYASYIQIGDKQFAVIIMSRVNPKKIRQSEDMKQNKFFVVNNSEDVRPYRILLYEKK